MSIQEIIINIKRFFADKDVFLAILLVLVGVASFGLGRASVADFGPKNSTNETTASIPLSQVTDVFNEGTNEATTTKNIEKSGVPVVADAQYVASKNGTKYHLPWCVGAKQIKEENKVWFNSKAEAEKAGYTPAGNCKGI